MLESRKQNSTIGIITIHRINNYGSVLQAFALQWICESLGFSTDIIDYAFPNEWHKENRFQEFNDIQPNEPKWIKLLYAVNLVDQHRKIKNFIHRFLHLSEQSYDSPESLKAAPPKYDIYITGSDQVWSPRHCNGDPAFLLNFAPDDSIKVSYASSIGSSEIPIDLIPLYRNLLGRYNHIGIREESGVKIIKELTGKDASVVLDPTLLLNREEWNSIATTRRLIRKKYILCYFLNYSFNAFPFVDDLAKHLQKETGYELVRVARPPHKLLEPHTHSKVGASPEDFIALVRDAEIVLTTSFHGTAFAVNYGKPLFSIIQDRNANDSRQRDLMNRLNLKTQVISIKDSFPKASQAIYDVNAEQQRLECLREESELYLKKALRHE